MKCVVEFLKEESGPTSVEYAVMLACILMICIGAVKVFGDHSSGLWGRNIDKLEEHGF